jgi:asparagine synthase (glutamine-hydrolysing)
MCGIVGIVLKQKSSVNITDTIASMAKSIAHRGPDGEGFILADEKTVTPFFNSVQTIFSKDLKFVPKQSLKNSENKNYKLAFGHRRLSIIDLSEGGHQPMCLQNEKVWITFNGEIYNYIEIKKELISLGYNFVTESDTEVVLNAYKHWGFECVNKFNGMWAFCIYDTEKQLCFASRDRLGVKPFYYINNSNLFSFASEQKAFVKSKLIEAKISDKALHNYLINGLLENESNNFFDGVEELFPGCNLIYSIKDGTVRIEKYYSVKINNQNNNLSEEELIKKIKDKLYNSVKLRLRSDVEVGTCLSGGIDSSALSGLMHEILGKEIFCFTSVFKNESFNEEHYADLVAKKINAKHKKIEPNENGFITELNDLIYSQDVPIWDSSTYSQFKVMQLAQQNNIKVVLDGQGADELFGGYHHHFVAKWNNLFSNGEKIEAIKDIKVSKKTIESPFVFYAKEKVKQSNNFALAHYKRVYKADFIESYSVINPTVYFDTLNEQLVNDIEKARLKSFLKCEDRCGMWHSVESRTPFSDDVELIDLMFSFNGNKKIKNGVSKYLLREAAKQVLPKEIYLRYDKKGFETPMINWIKSLLPQILTEVNEANFNFVDYNKLNKIDASNLNEAKILFKIFVLTRWKKIFAND